MAAIRQKITPFLWFDNQAEEAANFYTGIFDNAEILDISRYGDTGAEVSGSARGSVMTVRFQLDGQLFTALNGGPHFSFSPAVSFLVDCDSQQEVDELWTKLGDGGEPGQCGWLTDRFGLSWQIVPGVLSALLQAKDSAKAERVMQAMLQMKKLDIAALQRAYDG